MAAIHKPTTYKAGNIPNPFQEGQDRAYGDILLDKTKEMKWWRGVIGIGILGLSLINFIFFAYAVSLQKTVPILVNVMPSGEASYLGEVRQTAGMQVPEAAILYQARKFITNLRTVSTDAQVLYNNIDDCYAMVTGSYEPIMTQMLRSASPFDLVGRTRRTVEIESALKVTGSSYQVDWIETLTDSGTASPRLQKMRAIITIKILPTDAQSIKRNPLGIFIDDCEITAL
ncbi:MAG: type IV secretion system protein [Treponema sp.]|jgi:type IV secretion system protein VirB5|nr:type IV secretion system protein [Treponema sp.]